MNIDLLKKLDARALSICRMPGHDLRWGVFADPVDAVKVSSFSDVRPGLDMIASKVECDGLFAVGYVAYEAAGGLDPACAVIDNVSFPLVHFNFYDKPHAVMDSDEMASLGCVSGAPESLKPLIEKDVYDDCIRKVHAHIREGDIYQANFTFRADGILPEKTDPLDFFFSLFRAHPVPYAAYVNDGNYRHVSLSPELFLERSGQF
jgi:para-aminobenzoate synthetase/4-amino-4-deoxychorismate lyase